MFTPARHTRADPSSIPRSREEGRDDHDRIDVLERSLGGSVGRVKRDSKLRRVLKRVLLVGVRMGLCGCEEICPDKN